MEATTAKRYKKYKVNNSKTVLGKQFTGLGKQIFVLGKQKNESGKQFFVALIADSSR